MTVADQARSLLELAQARTPAARERLLLAVADLCENARSSGALDTHAVRPLLSDIFLTLVAEAEHDIRRRLSEKLARAEWPPRALINILALDDIEIARPVIASSPILADADLLAILLKATVEHQIAVARRPALSAEVVDALLRQEEPAVLAALAGNDTADIGAEGMARLVGASRRSAALRSPLARHPRLTADLAERLYLWVGQSLQAALVSRFRLKPEALGPLLGEAVRDAYSQPLGAEDAAPAAAPPDAEQEAMERRLIEKLHAAGQLRPGYLMRALREGKLSLFELALAKLGGFTAEDVRRAVSANQPELLALACSAVGLDRSVTPTVITLVRQLNGGRPNGDASAAVRSTEGFVGQPPQSAAIAFRQAAAV
ncbi:MAG TPA: DUF2336 domain-containing protein [Caulobacteraceae bacterium]